MNAELQTLFEADQRERQPHPTYGTEAYQRLRAADAARRERVNALLAEGEFTAAEDWYHAALIFQHGESLGEIWTAHMMALRAVKLEYAPARWLAAAALDRWLMYQGRRQRYGTQFVPDGTRYRVWEVEPETSDAERAAWDVPALDAQIARAKEMSLTEAQPPTSDAPWWLTEAMKRWAEQTD